MAKKAPAKAIEASALDLEKLVVLNGEVNTLSIELKDKKAELKEATEALKEESRAHFDSDLGALGDTKTPAIFGNHEYAVGNSLITVNYKMDAGGLSLTKFGNEPACELLPKIVGQGDYEKLFTERKILTTTPEELEDVAKTRPDLVEYSLNARALPDEALVLIRQKWPDAFTPRVVDEETYIAEIPTAHVETEVSTATGFISKVANLPEEIQNKLRDFTRKVFETKVSAAVKYGNRASSN